MRNGIASETANVKSKIHDTFDLRSQARMHPLATGAVAVIVGFAAAKAAQAGLAQLRRSRESSHEIDSRNDDGIADEPIGRPSAREKQPYRPSQMRSMISSLGESLMGEVEKIGRDVVIPTIIGLVTAKVADVLDKAKPSTRTATPQSRTDEGEYEV